MILVADSGSTKCDWVVLGRNQKESFKIQTKGINPRLLSANQIRKIIIGNIDLLGLKNNVSIVLFYGAGCASEKSKFILQDILKDYFPNAKVTIEEDLMAAVHGTTSSSGVVCILGTGSNCCYYDGEKIHVHQASLGYSVMDEGSGNYFGKKLLRAYFYNKMPSELQDKFETTFDLSLESVLKNLYEDENPSAYLANFAKFLIQNRCEPFVANIVNEGILELFDNLLSCYNEELKNNPLHFVGSIGYYLQEEILEEAKNRNIKISSFVQKPMDNIIRNISNIEF